MGSSMTYINRNTTAMLQPLVVSLTNGNAKLTSYTRIFLHSVWWAIYSFSVIHISVRPFYMVCNSRNFVYNPHNLWYAIR